jgi:tetratricopeptide (TPR) repeat protein
MSRFSKDISPRAARARHSRESSTRFAHLKGRVKPRKKHGMAQAAEPRPFPPDRGRNVLAAAMLALLTFLAFSNSFSAGFILDNAGLLLRDPRIRELTVENIRLILHHTYWWPSGEAGLYRPFTTLSYLLNYAVLGNGKEPTGYHCLNLLLHLGNVFLVFALARRLLPSDCAERSSAAVDSQSFALRNPKAGNPEGRNPGGQAAFFTAALWAVHPVLTESVTNMIGRSDLLSALAILCGFLMYLKSAESAGWRRLAWLAGLMGVTTVGVFSKESAVAIVGVIGLYELTWWKERKQGRVLFLGCVATLLPIAAMLYQRSIVLAAARPGEFHFYDNPIVGADFWTGRLTAIKVIARYLWLTLWPDKLSIDYSYAQIPLAHGSLQDWAAWITVLAVAILVVALYWWNRTAFFLASFAALTFVPTANLLFPIGTIMAERFLYIPAIGLLACLVMVIYAVGNRVHLKRFAPAMLCVITVAFAVRTWVRNGDWQDELALAEATVRTSPNSYMAHEMLAVQLYTSRATGSNRDRAIAEADRAVAILDSLPDARNNPAAYRRAGSFHLAEGDLLHQRDGPGSKQEYERAAELLKHSVAIDKSARAEYDRKGGAEWARRHSALAVGAKLDPEARWMLAAAYWRLGRAEEANAAAREALALHPKNAEAYRQISFAFAAQDRIDDAAITLIEGELITSDLSLRTDLLDLYHSAFGDSCAVTTGPNGPAINIACERVHKQFCAASVEVVKAALEDERGDEARQQKDDFLHKYGCPAGPLQQVLPD